MNADKLDMERIRQAGRIIRDGGLVAFPTETVYGLGGDALNAAAAEQIYSAKGRPCDNPLIVHISRLEDLEQVAASIPQKALALAEKFWPGPLTMIFEKTEKVPGETTGGLDTVAVRMPSHPVALALISAAGGFVAAPSANTSGRPSPTTAAHVREDLEGRIPLILDGGPVHIGLESTIVDMSVTPPMILRPGYITRQMLEQTAGAVAVDPGLIREESAVRPKAPGMKYRHYAPKAQMTVVHGAREQMVKEICRLVAEAKSRGEKVGVLASEETKDRYPDGLIRSVGSRQEELTIARGLYGALREFDHLGVDVIYAESFVTEELGQAIMNRLKKAAGQRILEV